MEDKDKTKGQLINELVALRQRLAEFETKEAERKRAEQALLESERRFKDVVENALEWIWEIDINGKYTYTSPIVEKILGYKHEELLKKHFYDLFHPEDREELKKAAFEVFARRESFREFINRNVHKNGKTVWLSTSGVPILDEEGNLLGYRGADTDITERKQTEEALRKSEEKYRTIIEGSRDAIYITTREGKIVDVNQAFLDLLGYTREELEGLDVRETYVNPDDRLIFQQAIEQEGSVRDFELKLRKKDGAEMDCLLTATVRQADDGSILGYQGIIRDITERKRAEEALREAEALISSIAEAIPHAVVGLRERRIIFANESVKAVFGWKPEELIGKGTRVLYRSEEEYEEIARHFYPVLERQQTYSEEYLCRCKDGRDIMCMVSTARIGPTLKEKEIVVVYEDITERKRAEQQLAYMATHDILTDLPNRMLFNDRLNLALAQAKRNQQKLAMMWLDLDRFKLINDKLGHSVGDKLLQAVGDRLTGLLRKGDTVARMGGDEFLILLPEIAQVEDTDKIAQKVLEGFQETFVFDVHELHITTSIGVVIYPDDGEDADTMMRHADMAMYSAKQKGRDNYQRYTQL